MTNKLDELIYMNGRGIKRYYIMTNIVILPFLFSYSYFLVYGLEKQLEDYFMFIIALISMAFYIGFFILPILFYNVEFFRRFKFYNIELKDVYKYVISQAFSKTNISFYLLTFIIYSTVFSYVAEENAIEIFLVLVIGLLCGLTFLSHTLYIGLFKDTSKDFYRLVSLFLNTMLIVVLFNLTGILSIYFVFAIVLIYTIAVVMINYTMIEKVEGRMDL